VTYFGSLVYLYTVASPAVSGSGALQPFQTFLSHRVQSMRRVAFSFRNSVASLLISRATTEKSAFYFSDSPFWFSGTMSSYCITVLWRRRRSKVHSSLIFVPFWYCIVQFFHSLRIKYGDVRETSYLFRRISIMLQRFNSVLLQLTYDYPTFWF